MIEEVEELAGDTPASTAFERVEYRSVIFIQDTGTGNCDDLSIELAHHGRLRLRKAYEFKNGFC